MILKTHIAFALMFALLTAKFVELSNPILFFCTAIFASILPDLDSGNFFLKHRGILHSLVFPLFLFTLLFVYTGFSYLLAFCAGYLSHIIADMLTLKGVMPFYPFSNFRIKGFIKTNGLSENILFIAVVIIDAMMIVFN